MFAQKSIGVSNLSWTEVHRSGRPERIHPLIAPGGQCKHFQERVHNAQEQERVHNEDFGHGSAAATWDKFTAATEFTVAANLSNHSCKKSTHRKKFGESKLSLKRAATGKIGKSTLMDIGNYGNAKFQNSKNLTLTSTTYQKPSVQDITPTKAKKTLHTPSVEEFLREVSKLYSYKKKSEF